MLISSIFFKKRTSRMASSVGTVVEDSGSWAAVGLDLALVLLSGEGGSLGDVRSLREEFCWGLWFKV